MKTALSSKVPIAWLIAVLAIMPVVGILFKLQVLDAPPAGVLIIASPEGTQAESTVISGTQKSPTAIAGSAGTATLLPSVRATVFPSPVLSNSLALAASTATRAATLTQVSTATPSATPVVLVVYVSGAVRTPGVYKLPESARVADALDAAGGVTTDADSGQVNLAEHLQDGVHIDVPRKGEPTKPRPRATSTRKPTSTRVPTKTPSSTPTQKATATVAGPAAGTATVASSHKVDINSATEADFESLPGIGPALAARILAYRQANGPFARTEDLMLVPGIKEGIFGKIKDLVTAGP